MSSATTRLWVYGGNGTGNGGGGGGGRIAVWYGKVYPVDRDKLLAGQTNIYGLAVTNIYPLFLGSASVTNGTGFYTQPDSRSAKSGSIIWLRVQYPRAGGVFSFL